MLQNAYGLFGLKNHIQRGNIENIYIYIYISKGGRVYL